MANPQSLKSAIKSVFGVDVGSIGSANSIEQLVDAIDQIVLEEYFSKIWQPQTKKYKYSGLNMVDEINTLEPSIVLDLGCGYNEFKGKIHNLTGVDPYNERADIQSTILEYQPGIEYDTVICLGSINFGSTDKIIAEMSHAITLAKPAGGLLFFRVNPGQQHDAPEAKWIEFFDWTTEFIVNTADALGCSIFTIKQDNGRLYFVLRRS